MLTHKLVTTPEGKFEVFLDQRHIVYVGDTAEAAYNQALTDVCRLGRYGSINPDRPELVGVGNERGGSLGHIIALAGELVQRNVEMSTAENEDTRRVAKQRLGALSTALAALTRVDME